MYPLLTHSSPLSIPGTGGGIREREYRNATGYGGIVPWILTDNTRDLSYTYCILSNNPTSVLSYQWLPTSIPCGEAMARRRKEGKRTGSASHGMVRRWSRFFSHVRHQSGLHRERVPDRRNASAAAVAVCSDTPVGVQRAARAAKGGVVDVSRALSGSPRAP